MYHPSEDTLRLEEILQSAVPGELISYEILSDRIGRNVTRPEGRGNLNSARRRQLNEGRDFETIFNKGLRLVVNGDQIQQAKNALRYIGNKARKTRKELNTTNIPALPAEKRNEYHVTSAIVTALKNQTSTRQLVAIQKQLADAKLRTDTQAMQALIDRTVQNFRSGKSKEARKA